jgi:hypothetical protein
MTTTLLRAEPDPNANSRTNDSRLVELVMALSGCSARSALELVRHEPEQQPLQRIAFALATLRNDPHSFFE